MQIINLYPGEKIIAVVPEKCSGPGWSNSPTWVYIETYDHRLRTECIQPNERPQALNTLFDAGEAMCISLVDAVQVKNIRVSKGD